ncbi:AEC family transporter [Oscillibacter sp.]|uniref:AEC family transporter n=1 Tax=Oscillibacter sp. TaxID=1945593 RepID=UPI00262B1309|nr:AEC family transporter [Oscillibacter sp.]MDD3347781.1 AEC family transporter [Oscillibacter sp.]
MSFFDTFSEMVVILFAVAVGYLAHRLGYLGGETNQKLSKLIINVTTPALILSAVANETSLPGPWEILSILLVAGVFYLVEFCFAFVVPKVVGGTPKQIGVWRFLMCFPNVGFIGYPLVEALFGHKGLFYAVILVMPFNLLNYSLGPLMLSGKLRFHWKQLLSPCIIMAIISLVVALGNIRLPAIIGEMSAIVGDVTIPLSLLVLGSMLAGMPARQVLTSARMWILSFVRLILMPATLAVVLRLLHVESLVLGVAVAQMAMPVAVNGTMLCLEFDGDAESMAQITFLTTVLSIFTIPIAAALFM